ncbi:MAG: RNA polymerase sigma factor [Acidimicrobiales bacterium]
MPDPSPLTSSRLPQVAVVRFDAVVLPEIDVLYRVARSITGNADDAEDLVQETLLRAFRGLATFDGEHSRAWLLTIMRNANINSHRRQRPALLHDPDDRDDRSDSRSPVAPSAEDVVSESWVDDRIDAAVDGLPPRLRQAMQLVDIDRLTYDEAAAVLGIPSGTVMSRLHRARRRVRDRLAHHADLGGTTP